MYLKDQALSQRMKLRIMLTLVWSVGLYGCDVWTLKGAYKHRITAFEHTEYSKMLRVSWREHRTNALIMEELQPKISDRSTKSET